MQVEIGARLKQGEKTWLVTQLEWERTISFSERSSEEEMRNVSGDREFLAKLAEASGGKCLDLEQVGMLPGLLNEAVARQSRMSELHLWDSYYLFVFVLSCLALEWAIRKRVGLA